MKTQEQYDESIRRSYETSTISELEEFEEAKQDTMKTNKRTQKRIADLEAFFKDTTEFYLDKIMANQIGISDIDDLGIFSDKAYGRLGRLFKYDLEWKELTGLKNSLPECEQAGSLLAKYAEIIDKKIRAIDARNRRGF
jgi:hypothetical protein